MRKNFSRLRSGLFEKRLRRKILVGCAPAFLKKGFGEKL
jgi:hypothetical protein